jgi:hypothetical protein
MAITDLAKKYYELRGKKDAINANLKDLNKKITDLEKEMVDDLHQLGLDRVDVKDVGSFTIYTRSFHKVVDREEFIEHLRQNDDEDILSVNHNTLNAYIKDWKSKHESQEVPGVDFATKAGIRMKKKA